MINMDLEQISQEVLRSLNEKPLKFNEISKKVSGIGIDLMKNLENMGFIKREGKVRLISSCYWTITKEGTSFLKFKEMIEKSRGDMYKIIMTLPPIFKEQIMNKHSEISLTDISIRELFHQAKDRIRILSPYVDASIIDYLKDINKDVKVQFLTIPSKYGKNPVLERLKQSMKNLDVKYLFESKDNVQQFQIHAKIIISDDSAIYIGSANFRDTSMLYNLESGIISTDKKLIDNYISIYKDIYFLV